MYAEVAVAAEGPSTHSTGGWPWAPVSLSRRPVVPGAHVNGALYKCLLTQRACASFRSRHYLRTVTRHEPFFNCPFSFWGLGSPLVPTILVDQFIKWTPLKLELGEWWIIHLAKIEYTRWSSAVSKRMILDGYPDMKSLLTLVEAIGLLPLFWR